MARRRSRQLLVPGAEAGMERFKAEVMRKEGYSVDPQHPENVKYEVADTIGVPLSKGYNGKLTTESAGKVGGPIGGAMVREMIKMAQQSLRDGNKR
jgi:small acid-soluble spore protein D (minor alpha/beta-type SASP)